MIYKPATKKKFNFPYDWHNTNIMITVGSPLAIRNSAPPSIRNALVFYCYFSTTIVLKVVVANENEINNVMVNVRYKRNLNFSGDILARYKKKKEFKLSL